MMFVNPIKSEKKINEMIMRMTDEGKYREALLFIIGINTGLRISDILKLKWGDLQRDFVVIKEQKTGKTRKIVWNQAVRDFVSEFFDQFSHDSNEYIFVSESNRNRGKIWSRQYVWKILNEYARAVGIVEPIGTHTLRKTFGYMLYKRGTPVEYIQKLLNHSSPQITLRYIGIEQQELDNLVANLNLGVISYV